MIEIIAVAGAGTMGSGIALATAQNGFSTILFDIDTTVLEKAKLQLFKDLNKSVEKNKLTKAEAEKAFNLISFVNSAAECKADLIIEAIIERLDIKISLLTQLAEANSPGTILASNTSSLSITDIQAQIANPARVAGLHFFNPAHIMKLVEVVKGKQTSPETVIELVDICRRMKKTPVECIDSPGFIVNRVARPFYLEAMKFVEDSLATAETIDAAMTAAGFKMGPFNLMDLIGLDINLAVSESVYEAMGRPDRFTPSALQRAKVLEGNLGRKTGQGFYHYNSGT